MIRIKNGEPRRPTAPPKGGPQKGSNTRARRRPQANPPGTHPGGGAGAASNRSPPVLGGFRARGSVRRGLGQAGVEILLTRLLVPSVRPSSLAAGIVLRVAFLVHRPSGFLDPVLYGIQATCACAAPDQRPDEYELPPGRPPPRCRYAGHRFLHPRSTSRPPAELHHLRG